MQRRQNRRRAGWIAALIVGVGMLAGCVDDSGLEIAGTYVDQYGSPHLISNTTWDSSTDPYALVFNIVEYRNAEDYLLAQNDAGNDFNPGLYSRFTWLTFGSSLYFCQDPYDAASLEEARNAPPPDASDPPNAGCGFTWSQLIPQ